MHSGGNLHSLWDRAIAPDGLPAYPRAQLQVAKGGETTYFIAEEVDLGLGRKRILVDARPAEPGEKLRDPTLRFLPDWTDNLAYRWEIINKAEKNSKFQDLLMLACKSSILFFCNTFCWSYDPRRQPYGKTPFVTYPFQDDVLTWLVWLIKYGQSGCIEKSRDMGASWQAVVVAAWLSLFFEQTSSLFMSMREDDVDDKTPEGSLLGKVRFLLRNLPEWMRGGWEDGKQGVDTSMFIAFPGTGSNIKGILSRGTAGRSGRATVCFNDEFAYVEESGKVLKALSELSNSKVYLSTPNGTDGAFYDMATDPATLKKTLHWYLHPLKNEEWARNRKAQPDMDEETWAQEHGLQYETSVIGRIFPQFVSVKEVDARWPHVQEGALVQFDPAYDVYSTSDLGVSDPCSTLFAQEKPAPAEFIHLGAKTMLVFFWEYQARDMTAFDLRFLLNDRAKREGFRYRANVVDLRTGTQRDSSGRTWIRNLEDETVGEQYSHHFRMRIDPGPPINVVGKRSGEEQTIVTFRNKLNDLCAIVFSRQGCPRAIMDVQNWAFKLDRATGKPTRITEHKNSHYPKAALYLVDYLYGSKDVQAQEATEDWDFRVIPRLSTL